MGAKGDNSPLPQTPHRLGEHDRGVEVGGKIARLHEDDGPAASTPLTNPYLATP